MFILDSESFKKARITLTLIFINVLFFFTISTNLEIQYLLVQINYNVIYEWQFWRLISAIFLHGDFLHLFSNMIGLLLFGAFIESNMPKMNFLIIYIISGLIGNLFSLILLPLYSISLGASGSIFGLIGASFVMIATENDKSLIFLGGIYLLYFIISSLAPGINLWAHIFGLLGGIFFGYLFNQKRKASKPY